LLALAAAILGGVLWLGLRSGNGAAQDALPVVEPKEAADTPEARALDAGEPNRSSAVSVPKPSEPDSSREEVEPTPAGNFSGVVVDPDGVPLAGVRVVRGFSREGKRRIAVTRPSRDADNPTGSPSEDETCTDDAGRFTFELEVELGDALEIRDLELEGYVFEPELPLLHRGRPATLRMLPLEEAELSIEVTDATTGLLVPRFLFEVEYTARGARRPTRVHKGAGPDGEAHLPFRFPRGLESIDVEAEAVGMVAADRDDPERSSRASFRPIPGHHHRVQLELVLDRPEREASALVSGAVYSLESGGVLSGAEVHHLGREVRTGRDGRFRIATEEGGVLWVAAEGYDHLSVEASANEELTLRLPQIAVLFGRVVNAEGRGVEGIELDVVHRDDRAPTSSDPKEKQVTDETGSFSFELRSGAYALRWDPKRPGETARFQLVELLSGERQELLLELEPQTSAILEGTIAVAGPDDGAVVLIPLDGVGAVVPGARVGEHGYRTDPMPLGRYAVLVVVGDKPKQGILLPSIDVTEPGRHVVDLSPSVTRVTGRVVGLLERKPHVVYVPKSCLGERMETLLGGLELAEFLGVEPDRDGRFELIVDLTEDGELQLYDATGLSARRPFDPRVSTDAGVWEIP